MYFNMFGGSALLHLLAGHPRVVAILGTAATVAMLLSPLGPGKHMGSEGYIRAIDSAISSRSDLDEATLAQARRAAEQLSHMPKGVVQDAVRQALSACGAGCAELTPAIVENDPALLADALLIYQLDHTWKVRDSGERRLDVAQR